MKKSLRCPKCDGTKLGRLAFLPDHSDVQSTRVVGQASPKSIFSNAARHGHVEAYVCTECGYFEEYVQDPASVPWATLEGFSWVGRAAPAFR